jgi:hypothetical protein
MILILHRILLDILIVNRSNGQRDSQTTHDIASSEAALEARTPCEHDSGGMYKWVLGVYGRRGLDLS